MSRSVELSEPDHFAAITVGEPGERAFFLQARQAGEVFTARIEKQQVAALAAYLRGLLTDLGEEIPDDVPPAVLIPPIDDRWVIGSLAIGFDDRTGRILVVAEELTEEGVPGSSARIALSPDQARAFVPAAEALVAAGRPTCDLCGRPRDPEGHICPRKNGHGTR